MKIEAKNRTKNFQFYLRIMLISFLPIMALMSIQPESLSTWQALGQAFKDFLSNPFLIGTYIVTLYQSFLDSKNKDNLE